VTVPTGKEAAMGEEAAMVEVGGGSSIGKRVVVLAVASMKDASWSKEWNF